MELKTEYEHIRFEQSGDEWLCSVKNTGQSPLCKIGRYGPSNRYYANITHCLLDNLRLLDIADFVGRLNQEANPATPEADVASAEAEQITEALALCDASV